MSRPKPEKTFGERLKSIFKVGITKGHTLEDIEYVLDPEILTELGSDKDPTTRIKAIKSLILIVKSRRLQEHAVELLWVKVQDLAKGPPEMEGHVESLEFIEAIIQGQYEQLDIMRAQFFRMIKNPEELLNLRMRILDSLTQKGREILHFEEEIGPFMQNLWPLVMNHQDQESGKRSEIMKTYLQIIINLLKFNSAYIDADVICSFIVAVSKICVNGQGANDEITLCLNTLDAITCYNNVPKEGLFAFVCLLCRMVNLEQHCTESWRIARNLFGTHLGHSALYCLCQLLQAPDFKKDVAVIRGAVFFVGMSLWGAQRVKSLDGYSAMTIMPTFINALDCAHQLVLYEVLLQTERLVSKHSNKMKAPGCDAVVSMLEKLLLMLKTVDAKLRSEVLKHLHNIVTILEKLSMNDRYPGSKHKLFNLIDKCSENRPEESVIGLISYRINNIYTTKPGWIGAVSDIIEKYYIKDKRPGIRCKALQSLLQVYKSNKQIHEEEILKKLILPHLCKIEEEPESVVRLEAIKIITSICLECVSKKAMELLDIFEKVIMKAIDDKEKLESSKNWKEDQFEDVHLAVIGLIEIFTERLCQYPGTFSIRSYHILVKHLDVAYNNLDVFGHIGHTRRAIFEFFMKLRANGKFHLGIEMAFHEGIQYSPYLVCRSPYKESTNPSASIGKNISYISLSKACLMVIKCLSHERDYNVLNSVLNHVPMVLQNKAVFVLYGNNIKAFVDPLIELTSTTSGYPENLFNLPDPDPVTHKKFTRGEFHNKVYPVLAALAPYAEFLENPNLSKTPVTKSIVIALLNGLTWKECSRTCIVALTACSLEMKKTMYNMIEKVLLSFSKLSTTKHVATPLLEFLSTLIRLPEVFCSFRDKNYLSVFAIALNFTNPLKFDAYTVSLAHHVIIMWFLKCRLAFRQNFVSFIVNGLNSNVFKSFEEGGLRRGSVVPSAINKIRPKSGGPELRLRSNSLSENSPDKTVKTRHPTAAPGSGSTFAVISPEQEKWDKMVTFHSELSETCVDILATYMFANVAVKPKRMPTAEFLLKNGQKASWIIGTKVITVTTSICDQVSSRGPLCDRCNLLCNQYKSEDLRHKSNEVIPSQDDNVDGSRRRHMSDAIVGSPTKSATNMPPLLKRRGSVEKIKGSEVNEGLTELENMLEKKADSHHSKKPSSELCSCWCNGWAEIHVRRPSGEVSWMTRIQNASLTSESHAEFPLTDITTLFHPDKEEQEDEKSLELELDQDPDHHGEESYSVFARGRTRSGSVSSASAPPSPVKEVKNLEFPSTPTSPKLACKSPLAATQSLSSPAPTLETSNESAKQSFDPIPPILEDEEKEPTEGRELKRRTSLQSSSGQDLNLIRKADDNYALATPPRTPHSREPSGGSSSGTKTSKLQYGSYGSAGFRDRAHTISGPSPRRPIQDMRFGSISSSGSFSSKTGPSEMSHKMERVTGISPQFVFLTLYHSQNFGSLQDSEKPMLINTGNKSIEASIKQLDMRYPHETHKIGVLYVGPGQANNETAILANPFGSLRYTEFLLGLGDLISLRDIDQRTTFVGGLKAEEGDGDYAYMWEDDVMQVIFHVATLMPNRENDPRCDKKKRHIGNDFVAIVYNNAGDSQEYKISTVKAAFMFACVVITPLDQGSNRVEIQCRPELEEPLEHIRDPKIVSDRNLAVLVRQVALHCNLAAQIHDSVSRGRDPYASNWLERLRAIKRIREKVAEELSAHNAGDFQHAPSASNDFTSAVLRRSD